MSDLVINPADVKILTAGFTFVDHQSGEAINAGQTVYRDDADPDANGLGKVKLAQADGTVEQSKVLGMAANTADGPDQPIRIAIFSEVEVTSAVPGEVYVLSANAGGIAPPADIGTGQYSSVVAIGKSTTSILVRPFNSETAKP